MLKILYNSQVAVLIVLIDLSGFKTTQPSVGFPAGRLQPILKNIPAKLVDTFVVTVRTGLTALVSTRKKPALAGFLVGSYGLAVGRSKYLFYYEL
ncbi:MAG: hypothetical protein UV41_C0060G0008 [Candidatus Daviesbacteria bacterium GW2011_GWA2_42_7]|uniref:Uncharacterized protein n=1 Tax=Candidatus Daviesbacteria bacterium GW2011_GWA2_42_7 TaxID=1618425 RepID=A0A0G1B7Q0_9BACT|nr:MAG: hypothetical protein UV41_C0060G0008 [Candidatus Daviesbacteria bacterium GW2011_GWA2_42_7]